MRSSLLIAALIYHNSQAFADPFVEPLASVLAILFLVFFFLDCVELIKK